MPMNKLAVCEVDKTWGLPLSARVREEREMEKKKKNQRLLLRRSYRFGKL